MSSKQISITFCGGCNPKIDRSQVAKEIQSQLAAEFSLHYNRQDVDFVIYLSGCETNCALRYNPTNAPSASVAGATVDALGVQERELATEIANKVRDYFEKLERKS